MPQPPTATTTRRIIKQLESSKAKVAAERDKLRLQLDELQGLDDSWSRAEEYFESAIQTLSELV